MSSTFDVKIATPSAGAISNGTRPLFKVPTDAEGGGITILSAEVCQGGSTNSSLILVTLDSTGTTVNGTITTTAVGGTASPFAANTPKAWTITTPFVDAGYYVGLKEGNVAAANAACLVSIKYLMGK